MIIKVKASTFIPAGTRCVTVALDGHWRPATEGAIEYAYARPNIDAPYHAVKPGDEFWVQIQDQIVIVHKWCSCGRGGLPHLERDCPPATSPNSDQPATPRCPEAAPDDKTESPIAAHHKQAVKDRDTALFALRDLVRAVQADIKIGRTDMLDVDSAYVRALDAGNELLTALCPGCKGKYTENDKHTCVKEGS